MCASAGQALSWPACARACRQAEPGTPDRDWQPPSRLGSLGGQAPGLPGSVAWAARCRWTSLEALSCPPENSIMRARSSPLFPVEIADPSLSQSGSWRCNLLGQASPAGWRRAEVIALGGALRSPVDGGAASMGYTVQRVGCFGPSEDGPLSHGGGGLHNPAGRGVQA